MDYEAIDRHMSSWIVTCVKNRTRFYLTDDGVASDILSRARVFRWNEDAAREARASREEIPWSGFAWSASRVAEEMANEGKPVGDRGRQCR